MRVAASLLLFSCFALGSGCCPLSDEERQAAFLRAEKIVVHYDPATKVEHFVRQVTFDARERVGFIVPSPTKPEIALADEKIFQVSADAADKAYAEYIRRIQADGAAAAGLYKEIDIVEQFKVGKFDVSIVKASDRSALVEWLQARRFGMPEGFEDWIQPYIRQNMFLAVYEFKGGGRSGLITETIRTTFKTERPLYPYRIPKQLVSDEYQEFRCFYISRQPARSEGPQPKVSLALNRNDARKIFEGFKLGESIREDHWVMTEFTSDRRDYTNQDLYFIAESNPEWPTHLPNPSPMPLIIAGGLAAAGGIGLALSHRRR